MSNRSSIVKSTSYVMVTLIIVKLIGFLKQAVIAAYFGTSQDMDLYLIASDFVTEVGIVFFSSLSLNFLSVFVQLLVEKGKKQAGVFLSDTLVLFIPVAILVIVLIWIFTDPITRLVASGYNEAGRQIVGKYIRIISITVVNICISNICIAVLEGEKIFLPGKLVGIIQSACLIIACVFFSDSYGVDAMLYGTIAYFVIQNVLLLYLVFRDNTFSLGRFWQDKRVFALIKLCIPLFISNAVVQLNIIVDKSIASHLGGGSVSALSYANYLFQTIHSIVIGSFCTVVFSYFSTYVAKNELDKIAGTLRKGNTNLLLLLLPTSIVFVINAKAIVHIIYERGAFDETSVMVTTYAWVGYAIGIIFVAMRDLLMRVHYAFQDTKNPMINGMLGVFLNVALSIILAKYCGVFGIAVADSVSYLVVLLLALHTVKQHLNGYRMFENIWIPLQLVLGSILAAAAGVLVNRCLENMNIILNACMNSVMILVVFFGFLLSVKCPLVTELWRVVVNKLKR